MTEAGKQQPLSLPTIAGLIISLFSLAFFAIWYRDWFGITVASVLIREGSIFVFVALLFFIIRREGLDLTSIGLHFTSIGKSFAWGMLFFVFSVAGILLCVLAMQFLGWKVGGEEGGAYRDIPVWVLFIMVVRAGIAEEVFYRGYAIERIKSWTGSIGVAVAVPLIIFSLGHFRQGPGGILISFVAGGILTATYLWKKDLLANMVAHFTVDFIPNVALPLLGVENS